MPVTGQRALAALGALWALWLFDGATQQPDRIAAVVFAAFGGAWVMASISLLLARDERLPAAICASLCTLQLIASGGSSYSPVVLLFWISIIVSFTRDHPTERTLLLRACVTCVYVFAALSKLNPNWLAGEQLRGLIATRPHVSVLEPLVASDTILILVLVPIAIEAGLGLTLWFRRTRWLAAAVGPVFHLSLIYGAGFFKAESLLYLAVLNLGLVALYPSFWTPIAVGTDEDSAASIGSPVSEGAPT